VAGLFRENFRFGSPENTAQSVIVNHHACTFFHCYPVFTETKMADDLDSNAYCGLRPGRNFPDSEN
jgi:hypothetical protein